MKLNPEELKYFLAEYIKAATKYGTLTIEGHVTTKEDEKLRSIARKLFEGDSLVALLPLLEHQNEFVKLYSAIHLITLYPKKSGKSLR